MKYYVASPHTCTIAGFVGIILERGWRICFLFKAMLKSEGRELQLIWWMEHILNSTLSLPKKSSNDSKQKILTRIEKTGEPTTQGAIDIVFGKWKGNGWTVLDLAEQRCGKPGAWRGDAYADGNGDSLERWKGSRTRGLLKPEVRSGAESRTWLKVLKRVAGLSNRLFYPVQPGNYLSLTLQETWREGALFSGVT